ncbi:carbohydrate ABC transporter permease [Anaerosacchariphilus polymeriproducens]|uniref:Carbohydrate ABC transporter permease n=1 Tax=Anaerosacchariphilus polymeriproducens TaxID=1812858 RepID=A0A371ASJ7_9FIRM|nr:carbohydrate ABC transporter permease [Anaerosacchariphilus polymeriproducens]RDU22546.1 carbohydrate ABC transporter permease [Anaerosacchariphilus polymeriproducens]
MDKKANYKRYINAKVLIYLVLGLGSILMIFPFIWMLITSVKTIAETTRIPPTFWPDDIKNTAAYRSVTNSLPFFKLYLNTILMIIFRIICALVFSSTAAYALAKLNFRGKTLFFTIIITQLMLPSQIFIIPQFKMISQMGMTNTVFAMVFPGIVSAFGTFFLRQAYMGIPDDIMEAARIDGCNEFQIFYKITMPLTKTAMSALAVFTALIAYSDLMWPLIVNTNLNKLTLSAGLSTLRGQYVTNYPVLMAGSVLAMLPMIVLYLIFQKQFVEGIALTGTKA